MKTRMRRFWISVSLAAGSLAFPLSNALRAHDLPTRWTSGANSTPSWNYLLDDCLDTPMLPGSQSLLDVAPQARRGTEDWASSCPTEWAAEKFPAGRPIDMECDGLLRNPISRFSKEMTCWVNEWQMIQTGAAKIAPAKLWAKLPDAGNPPAPDYSIDYFAAYKPVPLADTCAFDAEYQARQTAAELLSKEIARANEIAKYEAAMSQSLVDADRAQAVIDMDAMPIAADQAAVNSAGKLVSTLCGGESQEIMSANCFPNRFAPGIIDEYIAYDLDARDQHWLGGLGKSWKLRSALGRSPIQTALVSADEVDVVADEVDAWAVPADSFANAPEAFVAPDRISLANDNPPLGSGGYDLADDSTSELSSDMALESAANDAGLKAYFDSAYFDGLIQQAQQSALNLIHTSDLTATPGLSGYDSSSEPASESLPDLGQTLAAGSDWIEEQQCIFSSELCSFESAYQFGNWLGDQSLEASQLISANTIAMGHYLDLPVSENAISESEFSETAPNNPGMEVYVIYVDSEGNSLAVPSSLARAWNRPEVETSDAEMPDAESLAQAEEVLAESTSEEVDWSVLDQVGTQVISVIAKQLDVIGMRLMQASDTLSSWADTQIASREESSVR